MRTKEQISFNMSRIKGKNTSLEMRLGKALWAVGLRYRKQFRIIGRPDFALPGKRIAIFCDSAFWHGHNWKKLKKSFRSNADFWLKKIEGNIKRDIHVNKELHKAGWTVVRFTDEEILKSPEECAKKIVRMANRVI